MVTLEAGAAREAAGARVIALRGHQAEALIEVALPRARSGAAVDGRARARVLGRARDLAGSLGRAEERRACARVTPARDLARSIGRAVERRPVAGVVAARDLADAARAAAHAARRTVGARRFDRRARARIARGARGRLARGRAARARAGGRRLAARRGRAGGRGPLDPTVLLRVVLLACVRRACAVLAEVPRAGKGNPGKGRSEQRYHARTHQTIMARRCSARRAVPPPSPTNAWSFRGERRARPRDGSAGRAPQP